MASDALTINVTARVHGLWKIILLGWAIKLWRLQQLVTVETDGV